MSLSTNEIRAFLEIAATQNISRAAERLGTSQPALSIVLKRLEGYFGVQLFLRTKHGVELTKSAVKLVVESKKILRDLESLRDSVLKQETGLQGLYTIGFHPQVGAHCFPKFGRELLSTSAQLEIKLVQDNSRKIVAEVIGFNVDFGIVVNPISHPDLTIVPLYPDRIHFWVPKNSTIMQKPLTEFEVVICDLNLPQMEGLLCKAQRAQQIHARRVLHSSDLDATREFVSAGIGIGILPTSIAKKNKTDRLLPLRDFPCFDEKICLIYRSDFQKSQAAKFIKNVIQKNLKVIN